MYYVGKATFEEMANAIRVLSMDAVEAAKSGHPGMPMGMADVATVLFAEFLKFDPEHPDWPNRDRFVLSAGHGSMLLYSLLHLTGYKDFPIEELKNFRQLGAKTAGHPEYGEGGGIETTTGPLGQGLGNAVGMALAERMLNARYGGDLVDHYTYVIAGDGCLMEGISHEAISLAGHLQLGKLIVLFDDNKISIDGSTDLTVSDDQCARFKACGWHVQAIGGHSPDEIREAIASAKESGQPSLIACHTTIARGAPTKAGTSASHGAPLGEAEIAGARNNLGWKDTPFVIPDSIRNAWRAVGNRGVEACRRWQEKIRQVDIECTDTECVDPFEAGHKKVMEFNRVLSGELPAGVSDVVLEFKQKLANEQPKEATRKSSGRALEVLTTAIPELVGGSADLTGSNLTKTADMSPVSRDDFSGSYIYYGVREHAMCAAMNGMALHGGLIPYGGTFFVFTDYCRPAIRLAALMKQHVIYVMTHDSIGLGEDGPTHQPVEHLAAMRAMPGVNVFRPADATETLECWQLAVETRDVPSMLVLSRQSLPAVRKEFNDENLCAKGGYVLSEGDGGEHIALIATGSEVSLALEAQKILKEEHKISARVVSIPCFELFDRQSAEYKEKVLGNPDKISIRIGIEAASPFGWSEYLGKDGVFIGMSGFGASAPAGNLYNHFGITAENIVKQALTLFPMNYSSELQ